MNTFEELIANLIAAIKIDDLKNVEKYVNLLNNLDDIENKRKMARILGIHEATTGAIYSKSYDYILLNLNFPENQDYERWERDIYILLYPLKYEILEQEQKNEKENLIYNFILNQLQEKTYKISQKDFFAGLTKLAMNISEPEKSLFLLNNIYLLQKGEMNNYVMQ